MCVVHRDTAKSSPVHPFENKEIVSLTAAATTSGDPSRICQYCSHLRNTDYRYFSWCKIIPDYILY